MSVPSCIRAISISIALATASPALAQSPSAHPPLAELGGLASQSASKGVVVADGIAYVAEVRGLRTIDVRDPRAPREVGRARRLTAGASIVRVGADLLYVLDGNTLRVFRIAAPGRLAPGATLALGADSEQAAISLHVSGPVGYALVPDAIVVLDLARPDAPALGQRLAVQAEHLSVDGSRMYAVLRSEPAVEVYDLAFPMAPRATGRTLTGAHARAVEVRNGIAYYGDGATGNRALVIADVRQPDAVRALGRVAIDSPVYGVVVDGDRVYVGSDWLTAIDVSAPASPRIVGSVRVGDTVSGVALDGSVAYVAGNQRGGLRVIQAR